MSERNVVKAVKGNHNEAIIAQMQSSGRINSSGYPTVRFENRQLGSLTEGMYWDDMSGKQLDPELVKKARMEEIKELKEHTVYQQAPINEC